eukprot:GHVQ01012929.1.p1 GENE.GHVQ01012929.1~~GHVQ01012929.1.p1  ORF type:complete len:1219 (+),score=95.02 GHVQ01012929.1:380-4036(+)
MSVPSERRKSGRKSGSSTERKVLSVCKTEMPEVYELLNSPPILKVTPRMLRGIVAENSYSVGADSQNLGLQSLLESYSPLSDKNNVADSMVGGRHQAGSCAAVSVSRISVSDILPILPAPLVSSHIACITDYLSETLPRLTETTRYICHLHRLCDLLRPFIPYLPHSCATKIIIAFNQIKFSNPGFYASLFSRLEPSELIPQTVVHILDAFQALGMTWFAPSTPNSPSSAQLHRFWESAISLIVSESLYLCDSLLLDLMASLGRHRNVCPSFLDYLVSKRVEYSFDMLHQDQIGDVCRCLTRLNYLPPDLPAVLSEKLPYVLHEFSYWNLIDVAEMYLRLQIHDSDIIQRFTAETWKLVLKMRYGYHAKAVRVLTLLGTEEGYRTEAGTAESNGWCHHPTTMRSLIRGLPRMLAFSWSADVIAETLVTLGVLEHQDSRIYRHFSLYLQTHGRLESIRSPQLVCDIAAAMAKTQRLDHPLFGRIVGIANENKLFFSSSQIIAMNSAFTEVDFYAPRLLRWFTDDFVTRASFRTRDHSILDKSQGSPTVISRPLPFFSQLRDCSSECLSALPAICSRWSLGRCCNIVLSEITNILEHRCAAELGSDDARGNCHSDAPRGVDSTQSERLSGAVDCSLVDERVCHSVVPAAGRCSTPSLLPSSHFSIYQHDYMSPFLPTPVGPRAAPLEPFRRSNLDNPAEFPSSVHGLSAQPSQSPVTPLAVSDIVQYLRGMDCSGLRPPASFIQCTLRWLLSALRKPQESQPQASHLPSLLHAIANLDLLTLKVVPEVPEDPYNRTRRNLHEVTDTKDTSRPLEDIRCTDSGSCENEHRGQWITLVESLIHMQATSLNDVELPSCVWSVYCMGLGVESRAFQCLLNRWRGCMGPSSGSGVQPYKHLMSVVAAALRLDALEQPTSQFPQSAWEFCQWVDSHWSSSRQAEMSADCRISAGLTDDLPNHERTGSRNGSHCSSGSYRARVRSVTNSRSGEEVPYEKRRLREAVKTAVARRFNDMQIDAYCDYVAFPFVIDVAANSVSPPPVFADHDRVSWRCQDVVKTEGWHAPDYTSSDNFSSSCQHGIGEDKRKIAMFVIDNEDSVYLLQMKDYAFLASGTATPPTKHNQLATTGLKNGWNIGKRSVLETPVGAECRQYPVLEGSLERTTSTNMLTAYERLRESVLMRMGWNVAHVPLSLWSDHELTCSERDRNRCTRQSEGFRRNGAAGRN